MKVLSFIKNTLVNLIITLLILIIVFSVYLYIQSNVLKNSFIHLFGYTFFQVETGSMSGTMEIDDIIVVKLGNTDIEPQDIVTYIEQDYFVTHRVLNVQNDTITTKGDSNNSADAPIQRAQVIGEVIYIIEMDVWKKVLTDKNVLIPTGITLLLFIVLVTYKEKAGEKNERKSKEKSEKSEPEKSESDKSENKDAK